MRCKFCLFDNREDVERCHRCGIRLSGDITFDGIALSGATALAPRRRSATLETGSEEAPAGSVRRAFQGPNTERQTLLFGSEVSSNVIPFESFQRSSGNPPARTE